MSWRQQLTDDVPDDLADLVDHALEFGQNSIVDNAYLMPNAILLTYTGRMWIVGLRPDWYEPTLAEELDDLYRRIGEMVPQCRAVAVVHESTKVLGAPKLSVGTIEVDVEDRTRAPFTVRLPYARDVNNHLAYQQVEVGQGPSRVWP